MSSLSSSCEKGAGGFLDKEMEAVAASERDQSHFKKWVVASSKFSKEEKAAFRINSAAEFDEYWQATNDAKTIFDHSHERGCSWWAKRYQTTAASVQPFMNDLSPLIEIVRNFGAPYGNIAVGVISLLFVVASSKDRTEKLLASAIASIQDRLPGLKVYQNIYNEYNELDIVLQSRIVLAYQAFMDFCIVATKYYKSGGPRRWLGAMIPLNSLVENADKVQEHILRVRRLSEELLNKNVDSIKRSNMELKQDNMDLQARIMDLQHWHDHDLVNEVQRLLDLDTFSENKHHDEWIRHDHAIEQDNDEDSDIGLYQQMRGKELHSFRTADKDYQRWRNSEQSCLLILSGYNNIANDRVYQCWLSPIATTTVKDFDQRDIRPLYAYYALQPNGILLWDVVSVILLQLLRQKSAILRDEQKYAEVRTELENFHQTKVDSQRALAMERVALRVIDLFDYSDSLYIIIDRVDRCRNPKRADHRKSLLKLLVKMVEAARCTLRVLTVIDGASWGVEKHEDELGVKMKDRTILHTAVQGTRY